MKCRTFLPSLVLTLLIAHGLHADGPSDNLPAQVRRIPKLGVEVPPEKRMLLENGLRDLEAAIRTLTDKKDPQVHQLLPDVQIFWEAVHSALTYQEFFTEKEIETALELLAVGQERAGQLARGEAPWATATGLVVRGYISRIDGSVQPYGLVVPASYVASSPRPTRLDLWFHGRGETLSEVAFLDQRRKQIGTFAPADTIVLHPYGRYCNANKFAGEIDALEAMEAVQRHYRIDPDRIAVRGFSMGGASTWQFAVHYPGLWAAANPGAGFSETPEFLKSFQQEKLEPTWFEKKLWRWYDCTDWAINLFHCPTVAYSGELDVQKQAADVMQAALAREGLELVHVIGPQTKHAYHPAARDDVDRLISSVMERGRERVPRQIHFVTYTLRYNQVAWLTVDGLAEHWEAGRVDGELQPRGVSLATRNITALTLSFPAGFAPFDSLHPVNLELDGQSLFGPRPKSDRSWRVQLHRAGDRWEPGPAPAPPSGRRKVHGLQGPIDDAFLDAFLFVLPTGKCSSPDVEAWTQAELARATEHWRRHFRGKPRVRLDTNVTDEDIRDHHLVVWGDPGANALLRRVVETLPIQYERERLNVGKEQFDARNHVPLFIYPNPLNPNRYLVVNSSFTFRDFAYLNNARQVPKLPDWAIIDVRTPPDALWPGKVVAADFFNENWELKPQRHGAK